MKSVRRQGTPEQRRPGLGEATRARIHPAHHPATAASSSASQRRVGTWTSLLKGRIISLSHVRDARWMQHLSVMMPAVNHRQRTRAACGRRCQWRRRRCPSERRQRYIMHGLASVGRLGRLLHLLLEPQRAGSRAELSPARAARRVWNTARRRAVIRRIGGRVGRVRP